MTNQQQPALFDWATELSDAQGHVTLSEQEAHEIASLRARGVAPDPRPVVEMCAKALAEELAAWDIDPPLHHVKEAHDACESWLAAVDADRALRASHGQAPAQAAPAAVHNDLRARCVEVLAWRETGTLPGEALRTLAREKYGDRYDALRRAERDTVTEALNLVTAAPTTKPASQQEPVHSNDTANKQGENHD